MRFPNTVEELIAQLDERYPEVVPEPGDSNDEIMFAAGRRSLVNSLKQWRAGAGSPPPEPRKRGQGRPVRGP
jgi:hypothetical protein